MKKQFLLLIVATLLLSGCTLPFLEGSKKEVVQDTPVVQEVNVESETGEADPVKLITCDMLKNVESKENCARSMSDIAADFLSSEVNRYFDLARCDMLLSWQIENCKTRIQESGVQGPITDEEVQSFAAAMNRESSEVIEDEEGNVIEVKAGGYDVKKCSVLTTPGLKVYCEKTVLRRAEDDKLFEIVNSADEVKCAELTTDEYKTICKREIQIMKGEYVPEETSEADENEI